ncbi:hypothetical protein Trydic_g20843 [Trypoxylus dichotomus]
MVLQLMLPNGIQNGLQNGGISYEPNFSSIQDGLKRRKPESLQDSPHSSMVFNYGDGGSMKGPVSVMSEAMSHAPTPTPPEEKKRVIKSGYPDAQIPIRCLVLRSESTNPVVRTGSII